jgi:hypothetical protein
MRLYTVAGIQRFTYQKSIFIFISRDPETGIILAKREGKKYSFQEKDGQLVRLK